MVLLANLIQPANHLGVRIDPQFLASRQQKLLVDHVAQQILLPLRRLSRTGTLLLGSPAQALHPPAPHRCG